jgi:hypothetical protein
MFLLGSQLLGLENSFSLKLGLLFLWQAEQDATQKSDERTARLSPATPYRMKAEESMCSDSLFYQ